MMRYEVEKLVIENVRALANDFGLKELNEVDAQTRLYGEKSLLDSTALVSLIADIEEAVFDHSGKEIILADERAMGMRRTPFARVETLTDHIMQLLHEEE